VDNCYPLLLNSIMPAITNIPSSDSVDAIAAHFTKLTQSRFVRDDNHESTTSIINTAIDDVVAREMLLMKPAPFIS